MGKYIKLFRNHSQYETFIGGGGDTPFVRPNVSHCIEENEVHYNPWTDPRLIVKYNVTDTSNPTPLFLGAESMGFPASAIYDKIEIDNVEIDMSDLSSLGEGYVYVFESSGQHTVKYTLKDPTMIGGGIDEETGMPSKFGATFMYCPIASVEIPNSVTTIGGGAFRGCRGLTSITIPDSVTTIVDEAFSGCESLPIVDNIRYADTYAVGAVDETLTEYTIKNGTKWIGSGAFNNCHSLTSVTIPNSVTSIGDYAFSYCAGLTSVTIPNSVTSIGSESFTNCHSLTSVTIPNSVTSIGYGAFIGCIRLTSISVDSNNTVYDSRGNCNAIIETATNTLISGCKNTIIPNTVTSIGESAFSDCSGLASITIPNSVTSIGGNAFQGCTGLTSVTIGSGVTSIGMYAFNACSSLTSVTIPNSVTSIEGGAFEACSDLTSVTIEATTPPTLTSSAFGSSKNYPIYVPAGTADIYKAASVWSEYASRIREIGGTTT